MCNRIRKERFIRKNGSPNLYCPIYTLIQERRTAPTGERRRSFAPAADILFQFITKVWQPKVFLEKLLFFRPTVACFMSPENASTVAAPFCFLHSIRMETKRQLLRSFVPNAERTAGDWQWSWNTRRKRRSFRRFSANGNESLWNAQCVDIRQGIIWIWK